MTGEFVVSPPPEPDSTMDPNGSPLPRPAPQRVSPTSRGRRLLEDNFALVQSRLETLSRKSGLPEHEAEELRSWALFKLVENDYRILASWEGRSSFSTYLTVVLVNLLRDYRTHVWGRWRPSATARKAGPVAVLLERLWQRDRLPLDEAIDRILSEDEVAASRAELERLASRLPQKTERRWVGEEEIQRIVVDGRVEERIEERERVRFAAKLRAELIPRLQGLASEDRLLLRLHFRDGLTVAAISPILKRPQKELYSRRERCLKQLRKALEAAGLGRSAMGEALCSSWDQSESPDDIWE